MVTAFSGANAARLEELIRTHGGPFDAQTPKQPEVILSSYKHFPQQSYLDFDGGKLELILKKILEFNTSLALSEATKSFALDQNEILSLNHCIQTLQNVSFYHSTSIEPGELLVIDKVLKWPTEKRFPGLDLLRLSILHPSAAKQYSKQKEDNVIFIVMSYLLQEGEPVANYLMLWRFIANMWKRGSLRSVAEEHIQELLEIIKNFASDENKNVRVALATVLLNISTGIQSGRKVDFKKDCLKILLQLIANEKDDEVLYRLLVALGTIGHKDENAIKTIRSTPLPSFEGRPEKILQVSKEIAHLITAK